MAKKALRFRETDLIRAIKAADKAGGAPKAVEISKDGVIRIVPTLPKSPESTESNPWD